MVLRRLVEEVLLLLPSDTRGVSRTPFFPRTLLILPQAFSSDPLPYVRMQSLALIATLLRSHPEQEQNLLRLLVNKLVR
jgi:ribosome biogenesis protein MAK21